MIEGLRVPRVVCVGLTTIDVCQVVDRLPRSNEKMVAHELDVDYGGPAANAAGVCRLLGAHTTLVSVLGLAPSGRLVRDLLVRDGIEVADALDGCDVPVPVSTVLIEKGSGARSVVSVNAGLFPAVGPLDLGWVKRADAVLVDGHNMELCLLVAKAANELNIPVLLDGGSWKDGMGELLGRVDVAVFSADFSRPDGRDALDSALQGRTNVVAQSHGEGGVVMKWRGGGAVIAVPVVEVVDTLGAGDALHGALLFSLACAGEVREKEMRFATGIASLSCSARGARGWGAVPVLRRRASELVAAYSRGV